MYTWILQNIYHFHPYFQTMPFNSNYIYSLQKSHTAEFQNIYVKPSYESSSKDFVKEEQKEQKDQGEIQKNHQKTKKIIKKKNSKKDKNYSVRNQNSQRNQTSNTLKYFIKFLEAQKGNDQKIQEIMKKFSITQYSTKQFLDTLNQKFAQHKNYINIKLIKQICYDHDVKFSLIFRVFLRTFLKSESSLYFINYCRKLKSKAKKNSMKVCRALIEQIFQNKEKN